MCALVVGLCGCQSRKTGDSKLTDLDQQYKEKYERISEMNLDPVDESKSATADEEKSEAEPEDQPEEEIEAAEEPEAEVGGTFEEAKSNLDPAKTYAIFHTSMGEIITELYPDKAPKTVENFLGLATGSKEWTDPTTKEKRTDPLYNGTIFHRVIPGFMIQGGDPLGNGTGGPGYKFEDEFDPTLRHDQAGRLSMANSGKDTNGSQFFITQGPTPHLDDKHTIFGQVVFGQDAVDAIGNVARDPGDKPLEDVVVQSVEIIQPEAN